MREAINYQVFVFTKSEKLSMIAAKEKYFFSHVPVTMCKEKKMAAVMKAEKKKKHKNKKAENKESDNGDDKFKLKDVISLGGTTDDYEMLKNIKETEDRAVKGIDKKLKTEIADMVHSLGLEEMVMQSDEDEGTSSTDDEESEPKSASGEEEAETEEKVTVTLKKSAKDKKDKTSITDAQKATKDVYIPKFEIYRRMLTRKDDPWHEQLPSMEGLNISSGLSHHHVDEIKAVARQFWEKEVVLYQRAKDFEKSSDAKWLRTVLTSGTLSDRVAAITMLLQESPLHQVKRLESLLAMAKKKGRREAIMAIDSLRGLWTTGLLPDRKLRHFWQWPLSEIKELTKDGGKTAEASLLILWYFEDVLKSKCAEFVEILEGLSRDTIPGIRDKATGTLHELLSTKPEQEQKLLTAIVNKLGDPTRKVASRASYLLGQLVIKHPNMKLVVIQEVERLVYRVNVSAKTQYYAICFLNQLILTKNESAIASKLIAIYFSFFKAFATKESSETKMLSALLSGVNRAFPYTHGDDEKYDEQLDMLFKVCHTSNFQTSVQALMLLFQVMESRKSVSDRYYRVLYEKLLEHGINSTSKRTMFLNLVYKSMKVDPSVNRVKAFVKRLLQVGSCEEPNFVCGLLYLLSEVLKVTPGLKSLTMQPEEGDDDEHFEDITEDTFKAPNEDLADNKEDNSETKGIPQTQSGWTFRSHTVNRTEYDVNCRNPLYCGAQFSCTWEMYPLLRHFHPSVNRFAESVLQDTSIDYKGDPLQDFTIVRFLDRFMYKNPKKNPKEHGNSIMQPRKTSERLKELPVNSKSFMDRREENIREDEVFFYKYFKRKDEIDAKKGKGKRQKLVEDLDAEENSDAESEDLDFASEMQKSKDTQPTKKRKKAGSKDNESDDDYDDDSDVEGANDAESNDFDDTKMDDASDEGDFNYDDLEFSDDQASDDDLGDSPQPAKKKKFTDADYEKNSRAELRRLALLESLTDSDIEEEEPKEIKQKSGKKVTSMFAAADEFAHLLESSTSTKGQQKQTTWENRNQSWKQTKRPRQGAERKGKDSATRKSDNFKNKGPKGRKFKAKGKAKNFSKRNQKR